MHKFFCLFCFFLQMSTPYLVKLEYKVIKERIWTWNKFFNEFCGSKTNPEVKNKQFWQRHFCENESLNKLKADEACDPVNLIMHEKYLRSIWPFEGVTRTLLSYHPNKSNKSKFSIKQVHLKPLCQGMGTGCYRPAVT